ncbi:hypothetical protein PB1_13584 [Bacillus methanolicus PB1]|uniref:Uncharacterized protein n=1 Tax=Bacillus methanolicus PB1 TaxID=997296 RepID=I3DWH2_BACMT|nr:hypothetical protein [Bacillus methanolicus]EIJ78593.1 hypothetical protein PB1_13584 [Bacillus methanolicus PB1]
MYRFSIGNEDWIVNFSPHIMIETEEREAIVNSLLKMGAVLQSFSHGDSFLIFNKQLEVAVFRVEKIPSLILTIVTIVSNDKWYIQKNGTIRSYK